MNRVSLFAFAAALLLSTPAAILFAQEKTMTTSTGMELVWIPSGEFMMGSTPEEREWALANGCDSKETKREGDQLYKVAIRQGFWMGRMEVTVGQWKSFVTATGHVTDGEKKGESITCNRDRKTWGLVKGANWKDPNFGFKLKQNHPVSCISWNDAAAFCEWLTKEEKKANKLPAEMICRLPTEAEWEYACRAGRQTKFWWGDSTEGAERRCNIKGSQSGFEFVSPVDHFGPRGRNGFGLADMLGNVTEWCLDEFDETRPHGETFRGRPGIHNLRGGCFRNPLSRVRCAYRYGFLSSYSASYYGFRVCYGVPDGSSESLGQIPSIARPGTEEKKPAVAGVADKEMQKDARKFVRNQSSIKGLYVVRTDAGLRVGGAQDIIATAERASSDRETICDFVTDVAKDTQISMEEAERLLKVRYPVWQAGHKIRFSYSNKYTKQAGGSAGGAFSVLL
ncbi:MAG: formylglycine-generating enzyme family protein, partial [Verrucomicrobiia bacterium]